MVVAILVALAVWWLIGAISSLNDPPSPPGDYDHYPASGPNTNFPGR